MAQRTERGYENLKDVIFGQPPKSRVNVSWEPRPRVSPYVQRAKKILRLEEKCVIGALGRAIASAVEVAEILKREEFAVVEKIETSMIERVENQSRKSKIEIVLSRGKYAPYVSDYRRRRVIELFETSDPKMTGTLSVEQVVGMNLAEAFRSNEDPNTKGRVEQSKSFLEGKTELNLPEFIKYASILISPLLLEVHFKSAIDSLTKGDDSEPDLTPADPEA